jgi:PAS domain S-box-containing protein
MILVTHPDGTIINMNPAGYDILGYEMDTDSFSRKTFADFFVHDAEWLAVKQAIERQAFISNAEVSLKHKAENQIRVLVSASRDVGFSDKEDTIHFFVRDIEQRRLIEEQIAQADKLASIGQLSAGIAHEINNPLGVILGYTQLLIRNEVADTEKYNDLKTIEKQVRNCKSIVEDLLNFARSSKPNEDVIRVAEVLDEVINFIQQHAGLENIEVERQYQAAVPEMLLDEKKIKQVFINLIMNAKHAIGKEGSLSISTGFNPVEGQVIVKIADTGHGIEEKNLARIFDPFFTTKPTGEGTGLGLSVSYGIIKNHGGEIQVESKVGKGSTFTIVLPLISPHPRMKHAKIYSYH